MITKEMLVVQQEIGEKKADFLDKVEELETQGYQMVDSKCYDLIYQLAEITLVKNFEFKKVDAIPGINIESSDEFIN